MTEGREDGKTGSYDFNRLRTVGKLNKSNKNIEKGERDWMHFYDFHAGAMI